MDELIQKSGHDIKHLGFSEFFRELNIQDHFPVVKFVKKIPVWFKDLDSFYHVDFSGIEQVTDEVLFILEKEIKDDLKSRLIEFSFVGCPFLSDNGVEILSKAFRRIRKLNLTSCSKVTERSLFYLKQNSKELQELKIGGTNVGIIPDFPDWKVDKAGCPIFSDIPKDKSDDLVPSKFVILCADDVNIDMTHYIKTGEFKDVTQPITYTPSAFNMTGKSINVFELHCQDAYFSPFITEGAAFMIVLNLDFAPTLETALAPTLRAMKMVDYIRAIVLQATIVIVGLFKNEDGKKSVQQMDTDLTAMFNEQVTNMDEHLEKEHYSKSTDKDFPHQWRYVQSIQVSKKANFTFLFMGLPFNNFDPTWTYYKTLREIDPTDVVREVTTKWFENEWADARDGLERLNKADISEFKSFSKPPNVALIVGSLVMTLVTKDYRTHDWKQIKIFIMDHNLINKMMDFDTIAKQHDPQKILEVLQKRIDQGGTDMEQAKKVSRVAGTFWVWVKAFLVYFKQVAPLTNHYQDHADKVERRKNAKSSQDLMKVLVEEMFHDIGDKFYQWDSFSLSPKFWSLRSRLLSSKERAIAMNSLRSIADIEFSGKALELAIARLNRMGACCYFEYLREKPIFPNPTEFVNAVNIILSDVFVDEKANGCRVWGLDSSVPVLPYDELLDAMKKVLPTENEFTVFYYFLRNMGLLGETVAARDLKGGLSWKQVKKLYFSWHNVPEKACIRVSGGKSETTTRKFLEYFFPDYTSSAYNKNDINFKFSFKFRVGMAANLFSQIVCNSYPLGWTVQQVWQTGVLLKKGVVQMMLRHNIHTTMASSSLDLETRIGQCPSGEYVVYEYMWSVLSPFITMVESVILAYPHTHHKLRYYCRGECIKDLGKENTFSPTEMSICLERNVRCSKCRTYQMNQSEWLMLVGRQWIIPSHEYAFPGARSCDVCWKWRIQFNPIWRMQTSIYPSFAHFCFSPDPVDSLSWVGNILVSSQHQPASIISTCPLRPQEFGFLRLEFLDVKGLKLELETKRGKTVVQIEFSPFRVNVLEKSASYQTEESTEQKSFRAHDVFTLTARQLKVAKLNQESVDEEDKEIEDDENEDGESANSSQSSAITFTVFLKLNNCELGRLVLSETCLVRLTAAKEVERPEQDYMQQHEQQQEEELQKQKVIVSCRTYPLITARYFRPGTVVLRKTGVGGTWSPAYVFKVEEGLIFLQDDEGNKFPPLPPSSPNILPPGRYPDEINVVIGKKRFESMEQWYTYLSANPKLSPCSFALFQRLADDERYQPLKIRGIESRRCLVEPNAVDSILKVSYAALRSLQPTATPFLLLPTNIQQWQIYFISRLAIQHQEQQELHMLCKGNVVASKRQDMHLMNSRGRPLSGEEWLRFNDELGPKFIWTITRCIRGRMYLTNIDEIFPNLDPDIDKEDLSYSLASMMRLYRDAITLRMAAKVNSYFLNFVTFSVQKLSAQGDGKPRRSSHVMSTKRNSDVVQKPLRKTLVVPQRGPEFLPKQEIVCEGHRQSKHLHKVTADNLGPYTDSVQVIRVNKCSTVMPNPALLSCQNLSTLELVSCGLTDMEWVCNIPSISYIDFSNNSISTIPDSLTKISDLMELVLSKNPLEELPNFMPQFRRLDRLLLDGTKLTRLPENFGNMKVLRTLSICRTEISKLPTSFSNLKRLRVLKMSGISSPIESFKHSHKTDQSLSMKQWLQFCTDYEANGYALEKLSVDEWEDIFNYHDTENQSRVSGDQLQNLLSTLFDACGRLCGDDGSAEFPMEVLDCLALDTLVLSRQAIRSIPDAISRLRQLRRIIVDNCPFLESVSGSISECNIEVLALSGCPTLKTPPKEIISQGMASTIAYLNRLNMGSTVCRKTKLMLVGLGGAGKTSLIRAMMSPTFKSSHSEGEAITDGIDITTWKVERAEEEPILYSVWDFAGQTLYYNTHQFFLTGRSIYVLVWNIRLGHEHAGIQFWLNSIVCHAPKSPIFVIGTHADQVASSEMPVDELRRRYPSIVAFMNVSSFSGRGVKELVDLVISTTLKEPYMDEKVPEAWLEFEREIAIKRSKISILRWSEVMDLAKTRAIYDSEVHRVIRFLHELGSIQHFDTELLRDVVIVSPQWLVDVMACLVSVHNETIIDGRFFHKDLPVIWRDYRPDIRTWLLRLTETFDLTFPIPLEELNVVPCLLPYKMPKNVEWDELIAEDKIVYCFDYLPAGLFNRAQVRLCQFSDSLDIWQHGSLLRKNGHEALVYREDDANVVVRVHGPKPANMIMMIHEVFESLIEESFTGVSYRYNIPCFDCMRAKINNPALFSSRVLHHAIELNTSFIQCHSQFHCISIARLQSMIPAENDRDFLVQIDDSLNSLNAASKGLEFDIFLLGAAADIPNGPSDKLIHPDRLKKDLEEAELSVWMSPTPDKESLDVLVKGLEKSKIFMPLMSNAFLADEACQNVFSLAVDTLKKPLILGMVGDSKEWRTAAVGMKVSDHVYINFRPSQYKTRLKETLDKAHELMAVAQVEDKDAAADVFISYCWKNSALAVERGYARPGPPEALGFGDPVGVKEYLESSGLKCWLDVERVGVNGLFSDICNGLKSSSVLVAFVSDEYATSVNCQMEFRFAHVTLGLPIILAIVGTGFLWESTEIGMMSLGYPKINLQVTNHSGYELILQHVQEALEANREGGDGPKSKTRANKEAAFQEMYELAQRKLFRQIQGFVTSDESYPTLFVIDFLPDDEDDDEADEGLGDEEEEGQKLLTRMMENIDEEEGAEGKLGFRLLCEDESGWHSSHRGWPIRLGETDLRELLRLCSPFLARISLILKHSNSNLQFLMDAANRFNMLSILEQNAGNGTLMRATYQAIREHVRLRDTKAQCGYLRRCHMPSGKVLWLCPEHQKQPRVIPLDCNVESVKRSRSDEILLENLRRLSVKSDDVGSVTPRGSRPHTARSRPGTGLAGLVKRVSGTSDRKKSVAMRRLTEMRHQRSSDALQIATKSPELESQPKNTQVSSTTSSNQTGKVGEASKTLVSNGIQSNSSVPKQTRQSNAKPAKPVAATSQTQRSDPVSTKPASQTPVVHSVKPPMPRQTQNGSPKAPRDNVVQKQSFDKDARTASSQRSASATGGPRTNPEVPAVHRQQSDVGVTQADAARVITGVHTVSRTCSVM